MDGMRLHLAAVLAGFILDFCLGDPHFLPHPVRVIGRLIAALEKVIRKIFPAGERGELAGGVALVLSVLLITGTASFGILFAARTAGGPWPFAVETVINYYLLAARSLERESMRVYTALKARDVEGARRQVSMIVGRDTAPLSDIGIAMAAVETVAENTSDGVVAPLLYLTVGGPVAGWLYKAVNTMDSMVGYRNERYLYFGRAAARLDDLCNFLPARISAGLMILSAALLGLDAKNAVRIYRRDRYQHKSPNSAQTEAACAGALRIRLAGDAWYFGKLSRKPYIGDDLRPVEYEDIRRADRLMYMTAVLCLPVAFAAAAAAAWMMKI